MKNKKLIFGAMALVIMLLTGGYHFVQALTQSEIDRVDTSMSEADMQKHIHHLAHNIVEADQKWGHLDMTVGNVENLLEIAKANKETYAHAEQYINILTPWLDGDFRNGVYAHNFIWDLQGGTVGKATGLMSQDEIKNYMETH